MSTKSGKQATPTRDAYLSALIQHPALFYRFNFIQGVEVIAGLLPVLKAQMEEIGDIPLVVTNFYLKKHCLSLILVN